MKLIPILPAVLLPLAVACAPGNVDEPRKVRAPAATATGEPISCISSNNIQNTEVWDDYTIDFRMANGRTYRNTLDNRCPGLGFEERFIYETSISQLCSTDVIAVLYSGGTRGASCGLGQFVPVKVEKTKK
ncbi:MAG TPA: hypothetical protein VL100_06080 [Croceibacterium sp.]|nr:hypothetical protein [Croceibacterium sp.]